MIPRNKILQGCSYTVLKSLPDKSVDCCVTSPPYYGLRDYKVEPTEWPEVRYSLFGFEVVVPAMTCCLGLEPDPKAFIGHQKIAGKCTEQNIAGNNMLRVDVPETSRNPKFTRFLNHAAIYAINPVTEEVALSYAERLDVMPIEAYNAREAIKKWDALAVERQIAESSSVSQEMPEPDFDYDDD